MHQIGRALELWAGEVIRTEESYVSGVLVAADEGFWRTKRRARQMTVFDFSSFTNVASRKDAPPLSKLLHDNCNVLIKKYMQVLEMTAGDNTLCYALPPTRPASLWSLKRSSVLRNQTWMNWLKPQENTVTLEAPVTDMSNLICHWHSDTKFFTVVGQMKYIKEIFNYPQTQLMYNI